MGGQMDGWMDGQTDGWTERQTGKLTSSWTDGCTDGRKDTILFILERKRIMCAGNTPLRTAQSAEARATELSVLSKKLDTTRDKAATSRLH